jgi:hypothetical protein
MSYSFEARFAPTSLSLPETLGRLEKVMSAWDIHFEGEIMRLESREGMPTAMSAETVKADTVGGIATLTRKWWGVALFCVSGRLMEALGRTDAVEVTFNLFKAPDGRTMLTYREAKGAFGARRDEEALGRNLYGLMVALCRALEIDVALYDEENDELRILDLDEVTRTVEHSATNASPGVGVVVSERLLPLEKARELAGPRAKRVWLAPGGYLVFPFLAD